MIFSKHQKEIINCIYNEDIYDIMSYLKFFNLGEKIILDKDEILYKFNIDDLPKKFYYPKNLTPKYSNLIEESLYNLEVKNGNLDPQKYESATLNLNFSQEFKHEHWNNIDYTINFYDGIYIAKSFKKIIDFLSLWEFLKSEMLILDVPNNFSSDTLSLFYKKESNSLATPLLNPGERIKQINFSDFTYDDLNYLGDNIYTLSYEWCTICKDYLDRRIYPTSKLKNFIQNKFKTIEEKTQHSVLLATWLAIFVSIIFNLSSVFSKSHENYLKNISHDIKCIKELIQNEELDSSTNSNPSTSAPMSDEKASS